MKKEEITQFTEDSFKKIAKYFRKAISNFDLEDIRQFRTEIKKLKVFLHLLNMESEEGFSFRITKRMKTIYGYLGIVQNFQQLQKTNKHVKDLFENIPFCYLQMIEKELEYWKNLSKEFIAADYDFTGDKQQILALLPEKLSKRSIRKFIHYTLYELNTMNGRMDDLSLDETRKFIEDIYFNYEFIKPYVTSQQISLFIEEKARDCLDLFSNYRDKCMALALLQTLTTSGLDQKGKRILEQIESDLLLEKKEIQDQVLTELHSIQITADNLSGFAFGDS